VVGDEGLEPSTPSLSSCEPSDANDCATNGLDVRDRTPRNTSANSTSDEPGLEAGSLGRLTLLLATLAADERGALLEQAERIARLPPAARRAALGLAP
jgi:hypothetical protein